MEVLCITAYFERLARSSDTVYKEAFAIEKRLIKVAIIDDNFEFCRIVTKLLEDSGMYTVVGTAHNGEEGLSFLLDSETKVDVALVDVVLPIKDGFYILEELKKYPDKKPVCIMFTGVSDDWITQKAMQLGAAYIILKPFDSELLQERIKTVWYDKRLGMNDVQKLHNRKVETPEDYVTGFLKNTPISVHLKGFNYLKTAILMSINDMSLLEGVTKVLYPAVAKEYHATSLSVERSMRHAIESSWKDKKKENNYYRMLGRGDTNDGKPTIRSFISAVANRYYETLNKTNH